MRSLYRMVQWKTEKRKCSSVSSFTALKTSCTDDRVSALAMDSGLAPLLWAPPCCVAIVCCAPASYTVL